MTANSGYSIAKCPSCGGHLIRMDDGLHCEYCGNVLHYNQSIKNTLKTNKLAARDEARKAYEQLPFFKKLKINISLLVDDLWASFSFHLIRNTIITLLIIVLLFLIFWA